MGDWVEGSLAAGRRVAKEWRWHAEWTDAKGNGVACLLTYNRRTEKEPWSKLRVNQAYYPAATLAEIKRVRLSWNGGSECV